MDEERNGMANGTFCMTKFIYEFKVDDEKRLTNDLNKFTNGIDCGASEQERVSAEEN